MYSYTVSIPENDLSYLGWDVLNVSGVVDPIKTFMPKISSANERSADDIVFVNYMDMLVTMVVHRHKMETSQPGTFFKPAVKVVRTEYKYELAGRSDHPGFFLYRNHDDYITELTMVNMNDRLYDETETLQRMVSDDGVYFYDVQSINDILLKLRARGVVDAFPAQRDFHKYVLSECDDVKEMVAFSDPTINMRLQDALKEETYLHLHGSDPARHDPNHCARNLNKVVVSCSLSEYRCTYYMRKSVCLTKVYFEPPTNLESNDCVLRCYRLKWKGAHQDGRHVFVMYPIFSFVFKNLSLFQEILPEVNRPTVYEEFTFPTADENFIGFFYPDAANTQPADGEPTADLLLTPTGMVEAGPQTATTTYDGDRTEEATAAARDFSHLRSDTPTLMEALGLPVEWKHEPLEDIPIHLVSSYISPPMTT